MIASRLEISKRFLVSTQSVEQAEILMLAHRSNLQCVKCDLLIHLKRVGIA